MAWLSPLLLLAAVAAIVPFLLHLLRRREERPISFPALRYLEQSSREQSGLIRLRRRLLLALRMLVVFLLVMAAARWVLPVGGGDHPPAGVVLIVDNGLTSGMVVGETRLLDHWVERARESLQGTGPRDRIWVIAAGEPWRASPPGGVGDALAILDSINPSHVTPDLRLAVRRAYSLLAASELPIGEIHLLADLRLADPPSEGTPQPVAGPEVRVRVLESGHELPPNRGIRSLRIGAGASPRAGDPVEIEVVAAGRPLQGVPVRLFVDERLAATARLDSSGRVTLILPPFRTGWVWGRVEVDPDALRADDVRYFAFRVVAAPRVRRNPELSSHLRNALDVLADAGRIEWVDGDAQEELAFLPRAGIGGPVPGVLVAVPPSDPARLPALNEALTALEVGWRIGPEIERGERVVLSPDGEPAFPGSPTVTRSHPLLSPEGADGARVLLTLSDGTPWLVEVPRDGGVLLLLASPLDPESTTIPVSVSMIALVDMVTAPAGAQTGRRGRTTGAPLPIPGGVVLLGTPDGTSRPVDGTSSVLETGRAGLYRMFDSEGEIVQIEAMNPGLVAGNPWESEADAAESAAATRLDPQAVLVPSAEWGAELLSGRRGREVWAILLAAAFLALVAEGWLASSGIRGRDPAPSPR